MHRCNLAHYRCASLSYSAPRYLTPERWRTPRHPLRSISENTAIAPAAEIPAIYP